MTYKYAAPILIEPKIFGDDRGYFFEPHNQKTFLEKYGIDNIFVQDNESMSIRGVVRGLHYQTEPMVQAKLVRVVTGEVVDIAVDIRKRSPHFGKVYAFVLNDKTRHQLFVPAGFAHGFAVISDRAIFQYKVDNFYSKEHERGILANDAALAIDWKLSADSQILSEKDKNLPLFAAAEYFA